VSDKHFTTSGSSPGNTLYESGSSPVAMNAFNQYKEFLKALFAPAETVCFAFIKDGDCKKEIQHHFVLAEKALGAEYFQMLQGLNEQYNVYVGMNPFKAELRGKSTGRTKSNVAEVKRLYADVDFDGETVRKKIASGTVAPPPSVVLESSPGKFQFIWNVAGLTQETAEPLLKAIAQEFGTDPAVAEIARVLRVPGLRNRKYADAPEVKIVGDVDICSYDPVDFRLQVKPTASEKQTAPRDGNNQIPHGSMHPFLVQEAGRLRESGYTVEATEQALMLWAEINCVPPVDFEKVRRIARSSKNWEQGGLKIELQFNQQPDQPQAKEANKPIVTVNGDDFLVEEIPPRKILISTINGNEPVIFEQSINQVFAWRGAGKTCLGLGFVRALATGGEFLNFRSTGRYHVLYLEGELPDSQFQERWKSIVGETNGYAYMASIDKQPGHRYTSLAKTEGMQKIENTLAVFAARGIHIKVLMLDNISTLFNVKANEEEVWIPIQSWLTSLRSRGITVFFFHHAGKGGLSRSHSKSEDMLDVSIKLEEPDEPEVGHLHSLMTFDKARAGLSERPAEIKLHRTHSSKCRCGGTPGIYVCSGDGVRWEHIPKVNKRDLAYQMFAEGASVDKVKQALGVAEGTVKTWKTNWNKSQQGKKAA
jgi:hypothetical protein